MRILYVEVHDLDYPRNRHIREHLRARGHEVDVIQVAYDLGWLLRTVRLIRRARRHPPAVAVVVLSEFGNELAAGAKIAAWLKRAPLIVDGFVGRYETYVEDWGSVHRQSLRAIRLRLEDAAAMRLADVTLSDTSIRARAQRTNGSRCAVPLAVGAPPWAKDQGSVGAHSTTRVLYYGNYIPLHGLDFVLDALAQLDDINRFELTFVGSGGLRPSIEMHARELGLHDRIAWRDAVPESDLAGLIANCDVVLGIFGGSNKAATVVANKVWQGLACGRYVITRQSLALQDLNELVGPQLIQVDHGRTDSLTIALEQVSRAIASVGLHGFDDSAGILAARVQRDFDRLDALLERIDATGPRGQHRRRRRRRRVR